MAIVTSFTFAHYNILNLELIIILSPSHDKDNYQHDNQQRTGGEDDNNGNGGTAGSRWRRGSSLDLYRGRLALYVYRIGAGRGFCERKIYQLRLAGIHLNDFLGHVPVIYLEHDVL